MECEEIIAVLATPDDSSYLKHKFLYLLPITYKISEWSNDVIRGKYLAVVADIEIKISIRDKFAERWFRETKACGSETSNPNVSGHWVLE